MGSVFEQTRSLVALRESIIPIERIASILWVKSRAGFTNKIAHKSHESNCPHVRHTCQLCGAIFDTKRSLTTHRKWCPGAPVAQQ